MRNSDGKVFFVGAMIGMALVALPASYFGIVPKYKEAKALCEQSLPRDKQCVMYFKTED